MALQPHASLPSPVAHAQVPTYDFRTHKRVEGETTRIAAGAPGASVVIIDGIFVLWARELAAQCDLTVFCAEDPDVCLARRLRRDIAQRGRTVESVLTQYLRHVREGYLAFVAPSATYADLIVPRAKENTAAINILARDLRRRVQLATAGAASPATEEAAV